MKKILLSVTAGFLSVMAMANNITVSSATISGQNTTAKTEVINFDVAWENSWRTSTNENNYDGAWLFVKFRKMGTQDWRHCTINTAGFVAGAGGAITVPTDGKGAFIYKSANGIGAVNYTGNQLIWNYGVDGILDNETVEIRVFALEMVYIPVGSFQLGSGGTETNAFTNGTSGLPYTVASNAVINLGITAGTLNPNGQGAPSGTLPVAYPKGFNAFWIMKYECSQQQYVDFLNHLDAARALANNTPAYLGTHPAIIAPQPERAAGSLGSGRTIALADWSGLRPYSELEYEKIARGFNTPAVPNEYAWGNTTINPLLTVTSAGTTTEAVATPVNANACINSTYPGSIPVRTGLFARPSASDRILSGATYYGVMNMSDNLNEIVVSIINAAGKAMDASVHGDGYLASSGNADVPLWIASYNAYGVKGSAFNGITASARTSDRVNTDIFVSSYGGDSNQIGFGIRLARTAP